MLEYRLEIRLSKNIGKNGTGTTILRTKRGTKMNKILLLEDDLSLINGLTFAFQKAGFELDIARTIKE